MDDDDRDPPRRRRAPGSGRDAPRPRRAAPRSRRAGSDEDRPGRRSPRPDPEPDDERDEPRDDQRDEPQDDELEEHEWDEERGASRNGRAAPEDRRNGHRPARSSAGSAARRALLELAELTGHDVEGVVFVESTDEGWTVGIEVVETRRIPDSADILAVYEVRLDADGELSGYRRQERYARGQTYGRPR